MVGTAAVALANHASAGASFFTNMRTPAALLAAGALKDAFVMQGDAKGDHRWRLLVSAYAFLMVVSFGMEMSTVFKCTVSSTRLLGGGYDPMAESVVAMLTREFEWEYVSVRMQFVTGVLAFLFAQSLRVYKELAAFPNLGSLTGSNHCHILMCATNC